MKRAFDILSSFAALVLLSPLLLLIAVMVRLKMGAPIFFAQERPGLKGKSFRLWKFRTMKDKAGTDGSPLPDEERITDFGRFLRSTSLDELPELWNILRGDMSVVGPRPLLVAYLSRYTPEQARRHDVRPGLTGWAQINGRNALGWEERFRLDTWYVDHWTFLLDLKIIARTLLIVVRREGIHSADSETMTEFNPSRDGPGGAPEGSGSNSQAKNLNLPG